MSELYDVPLQTLAGEGTTLGAHKGKALLLVNVASKCGLTPQYAGLEEMHEKYADRGFSVLGFPCNQFRGQEPGSAEEIQEFCSTTYGITFPLFAKIDVNGDDAHPLYTALKAAAPASDDRGDDVIWYFEKFLVSADGESVTRFRPGVLPDDPTLVDAVEAALPG